MMPKHHPDDATLMSYSAGSLPLGAHLLVECHLACCEHCRQRVSEGDALGGALLEHLPVSGMSMDNQAILALLDQIESDQTKAGLAQSEKQNVCTSRWAGHNPLPFDVPEWAKPIKQWLLDNHSGEEAVQWQKVAPGISQIKLESDSFYKDKAVRLLKIAPGTCMPTHGHTGSELTLILQGSYSDEAGRFRMGDVADLDPAIKHQPIADRDQDCICFIVTDAPLRFDGWIPKLMQPFFGL
mgnify:FL=1